jgi:hypothetical protein
MCFSRKLTFRPSLSAYQTHIMLVTIMENVTLRTAHETLSGASSETESICNAGNPSYSRETPLWAYHDLGSAE